eukprot:TRINITY_DN19000_c0_g1_i1.p2 TRINITY_DN19000_c0_g1~~TRINITY_DN19000_c0_g1_i1.p2  ORF type:complete len:176 (+),score=29.67 TRINITY_DN19000_c0_g1_i1:372-899(+)
MKLGALFLVTVALLAVAAYGDATNCSVDPQIAFEINSQDNTTQEYDCREAFDIGSESLQDDTTKFTNDKTCAQLFAAAVSAVNETQCPAGSEADDLGTCTKKHFSSVVDGECKDHISNLRAYTNHCFDGDGAKAANVTFLCPGGFLDFFYNDAMTSAIAPLVMALFAGIALYTML